MFKPVSLSFTFLIIEINFKMSTVTQLVKRGTTMCTVDRRVISSGCHLTKASDHRCAVRIFDHRIIPKCVNNKKWVLFFQHLGHLLPEKPERMAPTQLNNSLKALEVNLETISNNYYGKKLNFV